jgi:hypothetical protein
MRKIEKQMNAAIKANKYWKSGNTEVVPAGDQVDVYLHGNHIATVPWHDPIYVNIQTFSNWPTTTTRSRLRALGVNASIKNGAAHIDGMEVTV